MRTTEELLEDLEVLAGHLEAAGSTGFAMSVREAHAEVKQQNDGVVTSDGRTVTVREWLAENVARRKKAEARLAEIYADADWLEQALRAREADPLSDWRGGVAWMIDRLRNMRHDAEKDER